MIAALIRNENNLILAIADNESPMFNRKLCFFFLKQMRNVFGSETRSVSKKMELLLAFLNTLFVSEFKHTTTINYCV